MNIYVVNCNCNCNLHAKILECKKAWPSRVKSYQDIDKIKKLSDCRQQHSEHNKVLIQLY